MSDIDLSGLIGRRVSRSTSIGGAISGKVVGGFVEDHGVTLLVDVADGPRGGSTLKHWRYDTVEVHP